MSNNHILYKLFSLLMIPSLIISCGNKKGCGIGGDGINSETYHNYNASYDSLFLYYHSGNSTVMKSNIGKSVTYGFGKDSIHKKSDYIHNSYNQSGFGPECYDMVYTYTKFIKLNSNSPDFAPILFSYNTSPEVESNWIGTPFTLFGELLNLSTNSDTIINGKLYSNFYTFKINNWENGNFTKSGKMIFNKQYGILAISMDTIFFERIP